MKLIIIGGTGLIGSKLVTRLRERGDDAVAASPDTGVNTLTGEGLADVLQGASVVVDVSNSPSFEETAVMEFFTTSTRNLLEHAAAAGVKHYVALSVVGTERIPDSPYLRAKSAQEKLIEGAGIPYSIVHATQFFEFMKRIADEATEGTTVRLPPVLIQPFPFLRLEPVQALQQLQLGDFLAQPAKAAHGIVVGKGNNIQAARLGGVQNIEVRDLRLLVIAGGRRVQM
jgi:uncharacterized protein YbjT (DUF2867 family)